MHLRIPLTLSMLLLVGCGSADAPVVPPTAPGPVEPEPPSPPPTAVPAPPPVEEARDPAVGLANRILAGDFLRVSAPGGDSRVLLLGIPEEPRPDVPVPRERGHRRGADSSHGAIRVGRSPSVVCGERHVGNGAERAAAPARQQRGDSDAAQPDDRRGIHGFDLVGTPRDRACGLGPCVGPAMHRAATRALALTTLRPPSQCIACTGA